jgi:hypothetical protein
MKRILVLGGGMGGVEAAIALKTQLQGDYQIDLISNRDFLYIYPASIWLTVGKRKFEDLCLPIPQLAELHGFNFLHEEVKAVKAREQKVFTTEQVHQYDYLVVALGSSKVKPKGLERIHSICGAPTEGVEIQEQFFSLVNRGYGAIATLNISEIISLGEARAKATAITIQKKQNSSRTAAWHGLSKTEQKAYKRLPTSEEIFLESDRKARLSSTGRWTTEIPYLIKITSGKLFVSKGFVPYGTAQSHISEYLGTSDRTIRRHLDTLKIDRRQIVQAKARYGNLYRNCLCAPRGGEVSSKEASLGTNKKVTAAI